MQSAFSEAPPPYYSMYGQNICHSYCLLVFLIFWPVRLPGWSSCLPQNIFFVSVTMLPHLQILPSDLPDLRNSIPAYVPEYPMNGKDQLYSATVCRTTFCFLPVYILRSSPAFQTDGFGIRRVPQYRERLFLFLNRENNWLMCKADHLPEGLYR